MAQESRLGEYIISTDKHRLDLRIIHSFLMRSYWAEGIPFEIVKKSIEHSLNFGVYKAGEQVGFARVITTMLPMHILEMCSFWKISEGRG